VLLGAMSRSRSHSQSSLSVCSSVCRVGSRDEF